MLDTVKIAKAIKEGKVRMFTGKLINFDNPQERAFEQRNLKAYKAGRPYFKFGLDDKGKPIYHITSEDYVTPEKYKEFCDKYMKTLVK